VTYALAAAGTGGHVYPALAVAEALIDLGVARDDIVFFGGDRMEADAVPAAGFDFVGVRIRGLQRSLSPSNLTLPAVVWKAARALRAEIRDRRVRALGVFGGYVSGPAALAARRESVPVVVHEQNAAPGLANRLISPRAAATLVAFPAAAARLTRAEVVGNPLRNPLADFSREELRPKSRGEYGIGEGAPVLGVLGGSLGALVLNETVATLASSTSPEELSILHLTGPAHIEAFRPVAEQSPLTWVTRAYEPDMEMFYAAADLVLARSGALTVSELAATGSPSVLVPLEATKQGANAAYLSGSGAAVVIRQRDIDSVVGEVKRLLADPGARAAMGREAARLARPAAAQAVAARLLEVAR
jgi:UDP-N-acetylglucosamine--N-acetylmuramyl-(pentapeptide) pyrophosphoryl-undecaprenol N-acetylglucosamine transferase